MTNNRHDDISFNTRDAEKLPIVSAAIVHAAFLSRCGKFIVAL
jgi:hypothetical protein